MHGRVDTDGENRRPQGWKKKKGHVENKGMRVLLAWIVIIIP